MATPDFLCAEFDARNSPSLRRLSFSYPTYRIRLIYPTILDARSPSTHLAYPRTPHLPDVSSILAPAFTVSLVQQAGRQGEIPRPPVVIPILGTEAERTRLAGTYVRRAWTRA